MRSNFQHLLVRQEEGFVILTMNRPEVLNAFNELMLQELIEATDCVAQDETIRCVVINGAGRAFGAGQDINGFATMHASGEPIKVSEHLAKYHRLLQLFQEMPKPVIAAVHGVAAGVSCNLALACDLRIAADNARFVEAFARIGLVPDGGGAYFLPRLVGLGKALEMMLLADEISGVEAERIGLANKCVPLDEFEAFTIALAQRLAKGPTRAYGLIKELMYRSLDSDLSTSLELEGEMQDIAINTVDHHESVQAFLEKRRANYTGR
ncbi:MAG: enoyl-CoA hydratase/isomerase family protein [Ktedonobacteraceae bacterium]|nr:enoyl-CoA hydratase/isomerase family protein [Ktedonobacteraceae bacterium]